MAEIDYEQSQAPAELPLWRESLAFYAAHATSIVKVLLPPIIIAYLLALTLEHQISLVRRGLFINRTSVLMTGGLWAYERASIPLQLLITLKQWFIWVCYCFALIGVCNLVRNLTAGEHESQENVFAAIRERPFRFLKAATLFFGMLVLAFAIVVLISTRMIDVALHFHWGPWSALLASYLSMGLVSAVIVRWAFAVPLAVLDDLPFGMAMRSSDRLTDNRTFPLWSLAMESEITGYLALIAPTYILFYLHVQRTAFIYYAELAVALFLSAMTQAPLMIGVGLVLAKHNKDKSSDSLNES